MTPALILVGFFFGIPTLLGVFAPTVLVYCANVYDWNIWQISFRAVMLT